MSDQSRSSSTRRPGIAPRRQADETPASGVSQAAPPRECPWCGSHDTTLYKRGLTGPTDERDQYIDCHECGRRTYEIVSRTTRDMRVGKFRVGAPFRDNARQTKYIITRVLKAGMNEILLYLKPVVQRPEDGPEQG